MTRSLQPYQAAGLIVEAAETRAGLDLAPITRMLDASYALVFRTRASGEHVEEAACYGVDVGYVRRLREAAHERMMPGWLTQLQTGSVFDRAVFGSDQQFARTPFYNHVVRPEGRFHCVIGTPFSSRSHRLHLVVGRPRSRPEFDSGDMRVLREILPLVNEVIDLRAQLMNSEIAVREAFGIAEAWPQAVLVVDTDRTLRHANQSGRHLFAACDALAVDAAARLRSNTPANDQRLQQGLSITLRTGRPETVILQAPSIARDLRLNLRRADGPGSNPLWVVITVEPDGQDTSDEQAAALARRHGLTKREADLLSHLIRGGQLKTASRQLGISYNTARSHLRRIFDKVDVHRQSDLMRLCATGGLYRQ